jgi:hypothetical protein
MCTSSWLTYAYQHTCKNSPLRNLAVDMFLYVRGSGEFAVQPDDFPREMLIDLAITSNGAIVPIVKGDFGYQDGLDGDDKAEKGPTMESQKAQYVCNRTRRSYLVSEYEQK